MTWTPRPNRQREAPVSRGKPCDWCLCKTCQGTNRATFDLYSILLADDTRMCDVCWLEPPCGMADDCDAFKATGQCEHRPALADNATWKRFDDVMP